MKVLHLISSLNIGGIETILYSLLAHAKQNNRDQHAVGHIYPGHFTAKIEALGFPVYQIPLYSYDRYHFALFWYVRKLLKQVKPDIIHVYSEQLAPAACVIGKIYSIPVLVSVHGVVGFESKGRVERFLYKTTARYATHYIAVNSHVRSTLQQYIPASAASYISIIYGGVDIKTVKNTIDVSTLTRADIGIDQSSFVIGSIGRLARVKSYCTLIKGFALFMKQNPHIKTYLCLVGDGADRERLEQLTVSLGIANHVLFLGEHAIPFPFLKLFNCYVNTCRSGPIALSIAEAMVAGLPIISTDFDHHETAQPHELLPAGNHFTIIRYGDSNALAHQLKSLWENQDQFPTIRKLNQQLVATHYSHTFMIESYLNTIKKVAQKNENRSSH